MSFRRFLRSISLAAMLSGALLASSCAETVRGAVISIDTELCEPGDGATAEYARLQVTVSRVDGEGDPVTFCASFDPSDPGDCAAVTPGDFPLILPIQSDSGSGTVDVRVELLADDDSVVACGTGRLEMVAEQVKWGEIVVARSCGAACGADAVVDRGPWLGIAELAAPIACAPPSPEPQTPIQRIAVGSSHACLVDGMSRAFCWGDNTSGQLGTRDSRDRTRPTLVTGLEGLAVVDIAAGARHTCAVVRNAASYDVRCWGENGDGQLGNGFDEDVSMPVPTMNSAGARQISAGPAHTCVVMNDGTVRCWGANGSGELGSGTTRSTMPIEVPGVTGAVEISAGGAEGTGSPRHTCARTASEVICWGSNENLQLGLPRGMGGPPTAVATVGATTTTVATGARETCTVDGAAGQIWCWGRNNDGSLGRDSGGTQVEEEPAPITATAAARAPVDPGDGILLETFSASDLYRCFVEDTTGGVQCFGRNQSGRLGNTTDSTAVEPVAVPTGSVSEFTQVGVGTSFACALPADGSLPVCWGSNIAGQLGLGTSTMVEAPTQLSGCE